jgi:hypothetical protein
VRTCTGREEEEKLEFIKIKQKEEENKKKQEEIRIETENRLPDFWKVQLNKYKIKRKPSKLLEVAIEEKRREIIKEWIDSGKIKKLKTK